MTTSFQELLKQKSAALSQQMSKQSDGDITVRIDIMLNRTPQEIHVSFNKFPGQDIINGLKQAGFRWNQLSWWAVDSEEKRAYCRRAFPTCANELEPFDLPAPTPPKPDKIVVAPDRPKTDWEIYTQQIDELLSFFRDSRPEYSAADLQLAAIAAYHKAVFSQN